MAFLRFRSKILISMLATTLVFALGMVLFAETVVYDKLHEKYQKKSAVLVERIAADCVSPVITGRYFEITMLLQDIRKMDADVAYAFVVNQDGRALAHTFAKGAPRELLQANPVAPTQQFSDTMVLTDKGPVHDIAVPLMQGQLGAVHVGFYDAAIRKDIRTIVLLIVLFSAFMLLAGIAASIALSRALTMPLTMLAGAAEAYGRGESNHRVTIDSKDEVGDLAGIFTVMVDRRRKVEDEREKLIHELQAALTKIKTLSGLLPICASCKKIRDDTGYWSQIENYISAHSDASFSHGICPDCAQKLYPEQWQKITQKRS